MFLEGHAFLFIFAHSCSSPHCVLRASVDMASRMIPRLIRDVQIMEHPSSMAALLRSVKNSGRAFATAAARASSDDKAVEAGPTDSLPESRFNPRSSLFSDVYNPFRFDTSLSRMLDAVDRIFDIPFGSSGSSLSAGFPSRRFRTPWDVVEDGKAFKLRMDMPGISKEELKISVDDGDLVIRGEHSAEDKEGDWSSRSYGGYDMRISLPDNIQTDQIKAELKNGVLRVTAPKAETKKNVIDVQVS